jgi:L-cysteine desulfidase
MDPQELLNEENANNDKSKSPLISLETDLRFFSESIREVAFEIMAEGLSQYPIFIAHQHKVELGEMILDKDELNSEWSVQASTLEEFIERGVIKKDLRERFISSYKNPNNYMCVFAIVPEGANFVYFPYAKD